MEHFLRRSSARAGAEVFGPQRKAEAVFYRKINVNPEIMVEVARIMNPVCVVEDNRQPASHPDHYGMGWRHSAFVPTPKQLGKMGITNVRGSWPSTEGLAVDLERLGLSRAFRPVYSPEQSDLSAIGAAAPPNLSRCQPQQMRGQKV
jgi:hypothetical protein